MLIEFVYLGNSCLEDYFGQSEAVFRGYNTPASAVRFRINLKPSVILTRNAIEIPVHFSVGAVFQKILRFRS